MSEQVIPVSRRRRASAPARDEAPAIATATKQLLAIAKKQGVTIHEQRISYISNATGTMAHAPVAGIERYSDKDFAAGVPLQVIFVSARKEGSVRNGAYLVKAQLKPGAKSGVVSFVGADGNVIAQRELIVRTREQAEVLFPDVYSNPEPNIPVITSTHVWIANPEPGHWGVDCSGWQPYRTLYYWVSD